MLYLTSAIQIIGIFDINKDIPTIRSWAPQKSFSPILHLRTIFLNHRLLFLPRKCNSTYFSFGLSTVEGTFSCIFNNLRRLQSTRSPPASPHFFTACPRTQGKPCEGTKALGFITRWPNNLCKRFL